LQQLLRLVALVTCPFLGIFSFFQNFLLLLSPSPPSPPLPFYFLLVFPRYLPILALYDFDLTTPGSITYITQVTVITKEKKVRKKLETEKKEEEGRKKKIYL
jgi:hypothetical protein